MKPVLPLMQQSLVKAAAHITGGGLVGNLPRVLPGHMTVELDALAWTLPAVFQWIANKVSGTRGGTRGQRIVDSNPITVDLRIFNLEFKN